MFTEGRQIRSLINICETINVRDIIGKVDSIKKGGVRYKVLGDSDGKDSSDADKNKLFMYLRNVDGVKDIKHGTLYHDYMAWRIVFENPELAKSKSEEVLESVTKMFKQWKWWVLSMSEVYIPKGELIFIAYRRENI